MQVRVCPKCSTENEEASPMCSKCYSSLYGVPVTEGKGATAQSPEPEQPQGAPPTQTQTVLQQPPMGPPVATSTYEPPPPPKPPGPAPMETPWGMIGVLGAVILAGLVYFVWAHTRPQPKIPAERVVVSFLEAKKTRTLAKVEPYMSRASVEMVRNAFSGRQAQSAGIERSEIENMMLFGRAPSIEELMVSKIEAVRVQDKEIPRNQAVVVAKLTSPARGDEEDEEPSEYGYEFVLVCEKNEWKVDLEETRRRESAGGPKLLQLLAPEQK